MNMGINKRIHFKSFGRLEVVWFFLQFITKVICLKDLNVKVPEAVAIGDTVTLSCDYDLEKAALYAVRWYFDSEEFYRYVAKEQPPGRDFKTNELEVDILKSNASKVTIKNVKITQSGLYLCEVSADAPLFHTESSGSVMTVVELPSTEPFIIVNNPTPEMHNSINKIIVSYGDNFKVTCISPVSHPPVNFTWNINNEKYSETNSGVRKSGESWSELVAFVDNRLFSPITNRILIRCETNIFKLYHGVTEQELYVLNNHHYFLGGDRINPTNYDHRNGGRGDPDNSALTGFSVLIKPNNNIVVKLLILLAIWTLFCCCL